MRDEKMQEYNLSQDVAILVRIVRDYTSTDLEGVAEWAKMRLEELDPFATERIRAWKAQWHTSMLSSCKSICSDRDRAYAREFAPGRATPRSELPQERRRWTQPDGSWVEEGVVS